MKKKLRRIIGVVGAEVNSIEQRKILEGIIEEAMQHNVDVAVISNLFNPNPPEPTGEIQIYDLIQSEDFDALILLSESIVSDELRERLREALMQKEIPVIVTGFSTFWEPKQFPIISTSDMNDIEAITDHLIDEHGYTKIDMLSGYDFLQISRDRVQGYRRSLEKHGIPYDESRVRYGDFWTTSGAALAEAYLNGEREMPEAVVCANDYMAFGLLDTFEEHRVNILGRLAVVGYEAIPERHLHYPLLTTYQRNRRALGKASVEILLRKLNGEPELPFEPPAGSVCYGLSCGCSPSKTFYHEELKFARSEKMYDSWNLNSRLEQQLTECTSLDEFISVLGEHQYLIRYVQDITLCLYDDWYRKSENNTSDVLYCRNVLPWMDQKPFYVSAHSLSAIISRNSEPGVYYFSPLFFQTRLFGHVVLRYDRPDTYDAIYRNWIKTAANSLEFLRIKNDVRYLTQCQDLAEDTDTMTGMYNTNGLDRAFRTVQTHYPPETTFPAVYIRISCEEEQLISKEEIREHITVLKAAAEAIRSFSIGRAMCGRVGSNEFILFGHQTGASAAHLADALRSILLSDKIFLSYYGMDALHVIEGEVQMTATVDEILRQFTKEAESRLKQASRLRLLSHYAKLLAIRNLIYSDPLTEHRIEDYAKQCMVSVNYLNAKYRECFGISFHQDCINSRLTLAKSLLCCTEMRVVSIAEACGYSDSKYFMRKFVSSAGYTPNQYRKMLS